MTTLTTVMLENIELLAALYREPAITAYNRLEARPRAHDFKRSLRAEVRDPLWFLTRQWQLGELTAEDAGSPIDARLVTRKLSIDRVKLGTDTPDPYDDTIPFEAAVEREPVPFSYGLRVQAAQYFQQLHPSALLGKYLTKYRTQFPLQQDAEADFKGQVDGLNFYLATRRREFDGKQVLDAIAGGTFFNDVPIDPADQPAMQGIMDAFRGWLNRQYLQPSESAPAVWDTSAFSYPVRAAAGKHVQLNADRYPGGRLDWYSFDVDANAAPLDIADPDHETPPPVQEAISFLPVAASFKGMPNPRFWEMEERQVNFGALDAQTTDHLLLVFAELGLIYGNDWFVVPYALPVNTLCQIESLIVTDVFGERQLIRPANDGEANEGQRWSLFDLSTHDEFGRPEPYLFLPSTVTMTQESDALERVQFARDEMANMVWAVEEVIPDATGSGISGHDAADKSELAVPEITDSPATIRYVLGTAVPENWIPFIPVQRPGSIQDITFQRAAMPKMDTPPRDVIQAKGVLLNEPVLPWFVNEEEIPFAGTTVTRSYQRVRWYDGRTYLWIGRQRKTGRGAGSSNLRFDQITPLENDVV